MDPDPENALLALPMQLETHSIFFFSHQPFLYLVSHLSHECMAENRNGVDEWGTWYLKQNTRDLRLMSKTLDVMSSVISENGAGM